MNEALLEQYKRAIQLYIALNDLPELERVIRDIYKAGEEVGAMKANISHNFKLDGKIRP